MKKITYTLAIIVVGFIAGCAAVDGTGTEVAVRQEVSAPSDATITNDVRTAFQQDDLLNAEKIEVVTEDGVVTLRGRLSSGRAANRAVSLARATPGVQWVVSDLELVP